VPLLKERPAPLPIDQLLNALFCPKAVEKNKLRPKKNPSFVFIKAVFGLKNIIKLKSIPLL
jgi:hypothetical protein